MYTCIIIMHSYNTTCINLHKNTDMTATTMALKIINKIIFHGDISVIYKYTCLQIMHTHL